MDDKTKQQQPGVTPAWASTQTQEADTHKRLGEIGDMVANICCYGGNNKDQIIDLNKTLQGMLNELIALKFNLDKLSKTAPKDTTETVNELKAKSKSFSTLMNNWDQYFRPSQTMMCINPQGLKFLLLAIKELQAEKISFFESDCSKLPTFELAHFKPIIANFTFDWITKIKSRDTYYLHRTREEIAVGEKYSYINYIEPTAQHERELLMLYMLNDIKGCGAIFGYGNCQLMAELAFLLAILKLPPTNIRLIHFSDTQGKEEELNAIAIGDWPKAGCKILAPWMNNKPFEWKGNLQDTPELKLLNKSDVYFSVDPKSQSVWQTFLEKNNFSAQKLLDNPNRAKFLTYINEKSAAIFEITHPQEQKNSLK